MKVNRTMTLEFTPEELEEIIKAYAVSQGFECTGDVVFKVSSELEGYGMCEHQVTKFKGATVKATSVRKDG